MKIMIFLHGTAIMHAGAVGKSRQERVRQVISGEKSVRDFASYVPVGKVVDKLKGWSRQGASIMYLSSHREAADIQKDLSVLKRHDFPEGEVHYRQSGESYADIAARVMPDVLIEDDCESIGGAIEMTYPNLPPQLRAHICSVVIKEFEGIDALPDDLKLLAHPQPSG